MDIERLDGADTAAAQGCETVWRAAARADWPDLAPFPSRAFAVWLRKGMGGVPVETWLVRAAVTGDVVGWHRLELPELENKQRASLHVVVHPEHRRQGIGGSLLRHAAERGAAAGRVTFDGEVSDGSAGDAFAAWTGATPGIAAAFRHLDLRKVPDGMFAGLRAGADRASAGYSLVTWRARTPERYLGELATVMNAYEDAPHDAGVEIRALDAERLRDNEAVFAATGGRGYTIAAVHDATGSLAAMTQVAVYPEEPRWGMQGLTAVTRTHRGHRLGLLLKLAMIDWLAEEEPQVDRIETGNASGNTHMIAVNEALGFQVTPPNFHTVELAVAKALGRP